MGSDYFISLSSMIWNILEGPFAVEFCGEGIVFTVFSDLGYMTALCCCHLACYLPTS